MTNKILTPRNARYLIVFFVILGLTAAVYGTTHKDLFDRGKRAYKSKQYSEAFSMFNQAVAQKPDKAKYQYNLGLAARKLKRYGIAYDAFSKAKTLDPSIGFTKKNNEFFKKLAEAKSRSGGRKTPPPAPRYAGAETARSHSESYEKGKQSYKNKDYKDAYQNFNEAIRHQPGKAKYHYNLGLAAKKLKRYREALNAFLEAKRIDPGLGFTKKKQEFYNKLTELQERLKESGSGSSPVASTRTDTPARAAAGSGAGKENFERGKRAYKNKEYKTAAKEFEKAVSQNPNKAKYHYNLGLAHMKLKDYQDALASLRKADRIDPAHKFTKKPDIYFDKVQELLTLIKDKKDAKKEAWEKSRRAKAIKSGGNKLLWGAVIAGAIGFVIYIIRRQGRRSSIGADSIVDEMDYTSYGNDRYSSSTRSTGSFFNFKKKRSKWKKKKHHKKHRDDGYYDRDRYADSDRYDRYSTAGTIVSSSSTDDDYTASRYDES